MVTRPLKTSMTTKAELVSEVRAGSRVGGSEKRRVNSPPVPAGESGTGVAVASVAGAVGTGVEVGWRVGPSSLLEPQAAATRSAMMASARTVRRVNRPVFLFIALRMGIESPFERYGSHMRVR